jgi:hypothetical protein
MFTIAKRMQQTQTPGKVYLADLEHRADRFIATYPTDNMVIEQVDDHQGLVSLVEKWYNAATPNDWLMPDNLGMAWTEAKGHVLEQAFGKDLSDWLVEDLSGRGRKDYGRTQDAQNKAWMAVGHILLRWPGHVLCSTTAKPVFDDADRPNPSKAKYRRVGYEPEGQKYIGHLFHTILYLADIGDRWVMTSVKDAERERVSNKGLGDFVSDYLVGIGKWTVQ